MPYKLMVEGGARLAGEVTISGAKNAALPLMAASLLAPGKTVLRNVPDLADVRLMCEILDELGAETTYENGVVEIDVRDESRTVAPYDLVSEMRASFCVLGPLLARRGEASVAMPGGCVLGVRPVDLHIKGFRALGASIEVDAGYVHAKGGKMHGSHIFLGGSMGPSVTGTCNVLTAAVLTPGTTVIEEAACEPEVQNLVSMLQAMGARIKGGGTPRLIIQGVEELRPVEIDVIPDRIEAGTFIIATVMTAGQVTLKGVIVDYLGCIMDRLARTGVEFRRDGPSSLTVTGPREITPMELTTLPYPGFPTDLQAPAMAMLATAQGLSLITEKIYPDRFMHVPELNRMGAQIRKENNIAVIHGVDQLSGCPVRATDLRAGAGLVLCGLAGSGTTEVLAVHHIDRGYERIEKKFQGLGASIERVEFFPRRRRTDFSASGRQIAA